MRLMKSPFSIIMINFLVASALAVSAFLVLFASSRGMGIIVDFATIIIMFIFAFMLSGILILMAWGKQKEKNADLMAKLPRPIT